jgi:uncharacterized protein
VSRLVDLGNGRHAHASGALWLPDLSTAVLADVHLGFGWALRRRGQLGPVGDANVERKLAGVIEELCPETVVFLGDLVHAPRPTPQEKATVERAVGSLKAKVVVVLGNHDRGFTRDYPGLPVEVCQEWRPPGFIAVHGDRPLPEGRHVIAGHIHPALGIVDDAGASRRMPVFVAGEKITLLPAFSPLAAGFDIRAGLPFRLGDPKIVAVSGKRAVMLGPFSRVRAISGRP